jgi:uncharacterized protein
MTSDVTTGVLTFAAAWLSGVMGSTHCFGMCSGLAGAVGMYARNAGVTPARSFFYALLAQLGRVGSYSIAGALVGAVGSTLAVMLDWARLAIALRMLAGALLIAMAIRVVTRVNLFSWIEKIGARLWLKIAPMGQSLARQDQRSAARALLFGAVWGWLPCGLVYSMLVFAALSGSAWRGALTMFAFGLGTLPAMLSSSLLASQLVRVLQIKSMRWMAAAVLAAFGVWTFIASGMPSHSH